MWISEQATFRLCHILLVVNSSSINARKITIPKHKEARKKCKFNHFELPKLLLLIWTNLFNFINYGHTQTIFPCVQHLDVNNFYQWWFPFWGFNEGVAACRRVSIESHSKHGHGFNHHWFPYMHQPKTPSIWELHLDQLDGCVSLHCVSYPFLSKIEQNTICIPEHCKRKLDIHCEIILSVEQRIWCITVAFWLTYLLWIEKQLSNWCWLFSALNVLQNAFVPFLSTFNSNWITFRISMSRCIQKFACAYVNVLIRWILFGEFSATGLDCHWFAHIGLLGCVNYYNKANHPDAIPRIHLRN